MSSRRALVIGGGFAGVAAAAQLRVRGIAVTLIDDRATLGGRARSDILGGTTIDVGAQLIASSFEKAVKLFGAGSARTGRGAMHARSAKSDTLQATHGRDLFVHGNARYPIQFGSTTSLLLFGGLGAMEKLKLGTHLLPLLARHRARLNADATHVDTVLDRESAHAHLAAHVSERAADTLVEPAFNAFYAATGGEVSFAFYMTLAKYGSDAAMLAATRGWSAALAGAIAGTECVMDTRISSLTVSASAGVSARTDDGREWTADGAVIATDPLTASDLLVPSFDATAPLLSWLKDVPLRPTWTLALALNAAVDREAFGVLRHPADAKVVSACAIHGTKLHNSASGAGEVVLAWPTPDAAQRMHGGTSDAIVAAMMSEIEALVPQVRGHVAQARLYRFDPGTPLAAPGFLAHRAGGRKLAEAIPFPIALAGDYLTMPMIEGAVASGESAGHALAEKLKASP